MKAPKNLRRKIAQNSFTIEEQTGILLRGYVRRTHNEYVEVVLVVHSSITEGECASALVHFCRRWPVDLNSMQFEEGNVTEAWFLDEPKFQVIQSSGEPEGYSSFFDHDDETFTVVSSIRSLFFCRNGG